MKMHWGYKIAILYCSFVVFMLFLVFRSSSEDFSLVSKDYYEKEIKYQQQIDKLNNSAALAEKPQIEWLHSEKKVRLSFPKSFMQVSGEILLYCPADSKNDFRVPVSLNADHFQDVVFPAAGKGLWRVQVDWQADGKAYFEEKPLVIQ